MTSSERPTTAFDHPDAVVQRWRVPDDADGERADVYLARKVKRLSRTRARAIIDKGDFRLIDGPLKPSTKLGRGATVELWRFAPDDDDDPAPIPAVIHEDGDILVIDKPGDLVVQIPSGQAGSDRFEPRVDPGEEPILCLGVVRKPHRHDPRARLAQSLHPPHVLTAVHATRRGGHPPSRCACFGETRGTGRPTRCEQILLDCSS